MHSYLSRISALTSAYRNRFPHDDKFLGHLPQQLEGRDSHICNRKNFSGHLTASALVIRDKHVLLIHHNFLNRWLQPGGHIDPDEEPVQAARREFEEETGLTGLQIHSWHEKNGLIPLDIDSHLIPANPAKMEFSHFHHDFLFAFEMQSNGASEDLVDFQKAEVGDCKWFAFAEVDEGQCGKRLARAVQKLAAHQ